MSDDLVKRLREDQPVTQDMASTMQCALQDAAADRIEELERAVKYEADLAQQALDSIEELEAKLTKAMRYFDEAMYFIDLDEEDILKGAGVYRIAKAYAELGAVIPAEWDAAIKHVAELKGQDDE